MTRSFRSAALLAALALIAGPASAQTSTTPAPPIDLVAMTAETAPAPAVDASMVAALASPDAAVRGPALHRLAGLTITEPDLDLRRAVPVLVGIYRTDAAAPHRLMALHVLHLSGDAQALATLRGEIRRPAPLAVHRALLATLIAHDGPDALRAMPGGAEVAQAVLDGDR